MTYGFNDDQQENIEPAGQPPAEEAAPADLAEALKRIRENNKEMDPVNQEPTAVEPEPEPAGEGAPGVGVGVSEPGEPGAGGGSSDDVESFDPRAATQDLIASIKRSAAEKAAKDFADKNYRKITVIDLRQEDEQGNVTYFNPDNKRRPFDTRMQAQEYVNSFNQQVDIDFTNVSRQFEKELAEDAKPTINLIAYVPKYNAMSEDTRDIFDSIIEPYKVVKDGQTIGFSCDLEAAGKQAEAIAKKFAARKPQEKTEEESKTPVSRPTTDIKSKGSTSGTVGDPEPKTIQEAMALLKKQKG